MRRVEELLQAGRLDFFNWMNTLDSRDYLLSVVAYGAAPTLLSDKPATLLSFQKGPKNLYDLWRQYRHEVCDILELSCFELKKDRKSVSVLLFRTSLLESCIKRLENRSFLCCKGYNPNGTLNDHLITLQTRFQIRCPHEIGLFLGFPVHDVLGFIKNNGQNCLYSRYWKVYQDVEAAKQIFSAYDAARDAVMKRIRELITIEPK